MSSFVIPKRVIQGLSVGVQGYGCMGLSAFYSSAASMTDEQAFEVLSSAYSHGVTLFNTADLYGPLTKEGHGHNLKLLGRWIKSKNIPRETIQIMCKVGIDTSTGTFRHDSSPSYLKSEVSWALECLGTTYLDIAVLNREDPVVPLQDSIRALDELKQKGVIKQIGMSEFSATNIRKANAITKIDWVEQEYSLVARDIEEAILPTCRELGISVVAYCPLGRGLLTGTITSAPKDFRAATQPRFSAENLPQNLKLVQALQQIAEKKHCSVGQLCLAWLQSRGDDIIAIPGTTKLENLLSNLNAVAIKLSEDDIKLIEEACPADQVKGGRYDSHHSTFQTNKEQ